MIEDIIKDIKNEKVDKIFFKPYKSSDDYFTVFGLKDNTTKVCRIIWINEIHEIFQEFSINYNADLLFNGEKIPITVGV